MNQETITVNPNLPADNPLETEPSSLREAIFQLRTSENALREAGALVYINEQQHQQNPEELTAVWPAVKDLRQSLPRLELSLDETGPRAKLVQDPASLNHDFRSLSEADFNTPAVWRHMARAHRAAQVINNELEGPLGEQKERLIKIAESSVRSANPEVRTRFAEALAAFPVALPELLPIVLKALLSEQDEGIRYDLFVALGRNGEAAVPGLAALLSHGSDDIAAAAVEIIGTLGPLARDAALPLYTLQSDSESKWMWERCCSSGDYFGVNVTSPLFAIEQSFRWKSPEGQTRKLAALLERNSGVFYQDEIDDLLVSVLTDKPLVLRPNRGVGESTHISAGMRREALRVLALVAPRLSQEMTKRTLPYLAFESGRAERMDEREQELLRLAIDRLPTDTSFLDGLQL